MNQALPLLWYDTECYPGYWLFRGWYEGDETPRFHIVLTDGECLSPEQRAALFNLGRTHCWIDFNGDHYDLPQVRGALQGMNTDQLLELRDTIIVRKINPWQIKFDIDWAPVDHIDLKNVAGPESQKKYAGYMHSREMRDLPYDPNRYLTPEERTQVFIYCGNDLEVLRDMWFALKPAIEMRVQLMEKYGVDVRSKSDAQAAEAIIWKLCSDKAGYRIKKPKDIDWEQRWQYKAPAYMRFTTPEVQDFFAAVCKATYFISAAGKITGPDGVKKRIVHIAGVPYQVGLGGIHSMESKRCIVANDEWILEDSDVAAYYPKMIVNSGETPNALGPAMMEVYDGFRKERIAVKPQSKSLQKELDHNPFLSESDRTRMKVELVKLKQLDGGFKIMLNGTFGKLGSAFSILFAPRLLTQTTLTGQLSILMLIERLTAIGVRVMSANTDGILTYCHHTLHEQKRAIMDQWMAETNLELEHVPYRIIINRDVNNYCAVTTDNDLKRKGVYAGVNWRDRSCRPCPDYEISSDAACEWLRSGTPIEETIASCTDIRKFITVAKVGSGGTWLRGAGALPANRLKVADMQPTLIAHGWQTKKRGSWSHPNFPDMQFKAYEAYLTCFPPQAEEDVGKVVRWYYSNAEQGWIKTGKGSMVSDSIGARPLMVMPKGMPIPADLDYGWYIRKAYSLLDAAGISVPQELLE